MKTKAAIWFALVMFVHFLVDTFLVVSEVSTLRWVATGFAASMVGRAVSYLKIGEFVRAPFTKVVPHSSGVGETVEPREDTKGLRYVLGHLMACPVCSGTWAAAVLLALPASFTWVFGAAGLAWLVSYVTEAVEWSKHKNWAETAIIMDELGPPAKKRYPERDKS